MQRIESIIPADQMAQVDDSTRSQGRSFSLNDMDSSAEDFWNMTLDDLTCHEEDNDCDEDDALTSSLQQLSIRQNEPGRPYRRRSDGMLLPPRATSTSSQHQKKKRGLPRRRVSFGKVQVREHVRVLGDNPSCLAGPSLGLGWKYHDKFTNRGGALPLLAFEKKRTKERKGLAELALSPSTREKIAKRHGYSTKDIAENVKQVQAIQRRRERTRLAVEKESLLQEQELMMMSTASRQRATLQRFLQAQASKNYGGRRVATLGGAAALRV